MISGIAALLKHDLVHDSCLPHFESKHKYHVKQVRQIKKLRRKNPKLTTETLGLVFYCPEPRAVITKITQGWEMLYPALSTSESTVLGHLGSWHKAQACRDSHDTDHCSSACLQLMQSATSTIRPKCCSLLNLEQ